MAEDPRAGVAVAAAAPEPAITTIADDQDKKLDPRSVTVARLTAAIWLLILGAPLAILALVLLFLNVASPGTLLTLGVGAMAYLVFSAWCLYWPGLRYRYASYRVGERGLWIRRGVLWRYEISVPKSRVQHTDVSQGPLQRRFDLGTLVLHTAGTQNAAVGLSGLSHATALAIRDYLIDGGLDDAV
ncbi:MAG: PH domain-containing protein [Acidobacteriota bacterium]